MSDTDSNSRPLPPIARNAILAALGTCVLIVISVFFFDDLPAIESALFPPKGFHLTLTSYACGILPSSIGTQPYPDLRSQLLTFYGQELSAHSEVIFAVAAALFAFVVVFTFRIENRSQRILYSVIVGALAAVLFYDAARLLLYGYLIHAILLTPYVPTTDGWDMQGYFCILNFGYQADTPSLALNLLSHFTALNPLDPLNAVIIAPFSGLIFGRLVLHVFGEAKKEHHRMETTLPFAWVWVLIFIFLWASVVLAPSPLREWQFVYVSWLLLAFAFIVSLWFPIDWSNKTDTTIGL